ncbi:MAG: anti-sigma factor [Leptolyngbyaceae bacterium]|nr:anti-sigma factor [Leptolyngbyaceae bacterium]
MSNSSPKPPIDSHLEELLSGYVLGALSSDETAEIEQYLNENSELGQRLQELQDELQNVAGYLAYAYQHPAPEQLRAKILKIPLEASQAPLTTVPSVTDAVSLSERRQQRPRRTRLWQPLGWAIAASLMIGLGIDNILLRQQLSQVATEIETHDDEEYVFTLEHTGAIADASAKVVVVADAGEVLLGVRNLPPLPPQEAYHLWAFMTDDQKILCGQFNTDASGQILEHFSVSPEIYTAPIEFMRISREAVNPSSTSTAERQVVLTSES